MSNFITEKPITLYTPEQVATLSPEQKLQASRTLLAAGHSYESIEAKFGPNEATSPKGRAQTEKSLLKNDKAWVTKYLDGDVEARRKMADLDHIISSVS